MQNKRLLNDPGMEVIRHADTGYDAAKEKTIAHDLDLIDKLRKV